MNTNIICVVYSVLLSIRVVFPTLSSIAMFSMLCFNSFLYLSNRRSSELALMSSFLMPGEIFPTINLILGLLIQDRNTIKKIDKFDIPSVFLFFIILIYSLISAIVTKAIPNFAFSVLYLVLVFFIFYRGKKNIGIAGIVISEKKFIIIEFVVTIIIVIRNRSLTPGDIFSGSLESAHWFGNWLIIALVLLFYNGKGVSGLKLKKKWFKRNIVYILLITIMLYLADAKSLLIAFFIGIVGYLVFDFIFRCKYSFLIFSITFCLSLFFLFYLLYYTPLKELIIQNSSVLSTYLYQIGWNGKFEYIRGSLLEELSMPYFLFGYGLGQYGSRVANMFAYNVMWRADNSINNLIKMLFEPHCIPQYAKYIKFYNADFVAQIGWRSAVMSYPFNSITAMIAETGLIGVVFFSYFFNKYLSKSNCRVLGFYFFVACLFDLYFDNLPCLALLIVIILNTTPPKKKIIPNTNRCSRIVSD